MSIKSTVSTFFLHRMLAPVSQIASERHLGTFERRSAVILCGVDFWGSEAENKQQIIQLIPGSCANGHKGASQENLLRVTDVLQYQRSNRTLNF